MTRSTNEIEILTDDACDAIDGGCRVAYGTLYGPTIVGVCGALLRGKHAGASDDGFSLGDSLAGLTAADLRGL